MSVRRWTRRTAHFLGGICKDWRQIAWSTPLIWNMVSRKAHGSQVQLLRNWLLRANSSPKLTFGDEHESKFCSVCAIWSMDVLVTRSTYWKSFNCLLPPQCDDILNHFPMLTSISLRSPGTISTFSQPPNMFFSAPELIVVG